jgi:single-stranded DNA-specific DHH superfamily exonuclease
MVKASPCCLILITDHPSAKAQKPTLIVPDKDADGLSSGVIVHRTLVKLGLDSKLLDVHLVQKGSNIHEEDERKVMLEKKPTFVIVLDQGSRSGPPVIDDPDVKFLLIDHHLSDEFPKDAQVSQIVENEISKLT